MRYLVGLLLSSLFLSVTLADPIVPPLIQRQHIAVFIDATQNPQLTAADLAAELNPPQQQFNSTLYTQLGSPIQAEPLYHLLPLPEFLTYEPNSPRWLAERYLLLSYPASTSTEELITLLQNAQLFGSVQKLNEPTFSTINPNDPYWSNYAGIAAPYNNARWPLQQMNFHNAWEWTKGYAYVNVVDSGIYNDGVQVHEDLRQNFRRQLSLLRGTTLWDLRDDVFGASGHGTHVAGIIAATSNNNLGTTGACWDCSLIVTNLDQNLSFANSLKWGIQQGAQVINRSGANPATLLTYANCNIAGQEDDPYCPALYEAAARDVGLVVSSGNDKYNQVGFPANVPWAIAVGGTDAYGSLWAETTCPALIPPAPYPPGASYECGSNYGAKQEFVAPAKAIISTFGFGTTWSAYSKCAEVSSVNNPYPFPPSSYEYCTGTSMSAPFVTAAVALVRSVNPLLPMSEVRQALRETASGGGVRNDIMGYGIPNVEAAVKLALGRAFDSQSIDWIQQVNRLTPMFYLTNFNRVTSSPSFDCKGNGRNDSPGPEAHLFSTRPQVMAAALANELYIAHLECSPPQTWAFAATGVNGATVPGYHAYPIEYSTLSQFSHYTKPYAAFYLFSTDKPANYIWGSALKPLYRLSFDSPWPTYPSISDPCPGMGRDFMYATDSQQSTINYYTNNNFCAGMANTSYHTDGIEGYVLSTCPPGKYCDGRASEGGLQCLHVRGNSQSGNDWALLLDEQLPGKPKNSIPFTNHTLIPQGMNNSCLGYMFKNMDSDNDGLIDGWELMLGTNPNNPDTDGDGMTDSVEFPPYGIQRTNPVRPDPNSDIIFQDDFDY